MGAPHETADRTFAPPDDFAGQQVVPPMGAPATADAGDPDATATTTATFPATVTVPPQPQRQGQVQVVSVGTPLATVVGMPANPFLD